MLATRVPWLGRPRAFVFDEVYYALDAADLLRHGVEANPAHPPLAKWLIAGGIRLAGFTPLGWRLAALLAGVAVVLLTWAAARKVTGDHRLAVAAGGFVALDGIAFVTGRLALLDGFVAVATTGTAWCVLGALADRDDPERLRRWRWAAAILIGAGVAMKWGAAWTWPVAAIVLVALEGRSRALRSLAVLVVVPAAIYVVAYVPWLVQAEQTRAGLARCADKEVALEDCSLGVVERVGVWVQHQRDLVDYHANLETDNDEADPAWHWALMTDPSDLFDRLCRPADAVAPDDLDDGVCPGGDPKEVDDTEAHVLAVANPVSWAAGLLSLVGLAVLTVRRRDDAAGVVLALAASQWLPWMLSGREVYTYYAVSLVPLLALGTVLVLDRLPRLRRVALVPLVVGTVLAFLFLHPILSGAALDPGAADLRLLLPGWS